MGLKTDLAGVEGQEAFLDDDSRREDTRGDTTGGRGAWLGLVAAIFLTLPAIMPLALPGMPLTDDGRYHVGRIADLREALAGGQIFPRWLEPVVEGLGFPLFNFYPSLSHYFSLSLTLLGLSDTDAFKLASALFPVLAAATMYAWAIEILGKPIGRVYPRHLAALGAAIVYAYAPYQLVDIYRRGSLAESFALALLPLLFCATSRLLRHPCLGNSLLFAPILSALVIAHNVTAVLGFGLALGLGACTVLARRFSSPLPASRSASLRSVLSYSALAIGLGLGLSFFFWGPAIFERGYLNFERLSTGFFAADNHLADAWPPFQLSPVFDFPDSFRLGFAQAAVLALGLAPLAALAYRQVRRGRIADAGIVLRREHMVATAFFAMSALAIIFLLSPWALGIWGHAPFLKDMQYPWRTLGIFAFSSATLAGIGLLWLASRWPRAFPFLAAALMVAYAAALLPGLPTDFPPPTQETPGTASLVAASAGWDMRPTQPARSLSPNEVGGLTSLTAMRRQPGRLDLAVEASRATTVVLHVLYFPGWKVSVDGQETPIFPVSERGLLGFTVSPGSHVVNARFEATALRGAAEAVSLTCAVVMVALLAFSLARRFKGGSGKWTVASEMAVVPAPDAPAKRVDASYRGLESNEDGSPPSTGRPRRDRPYGLNKSRNEHQTSIGAAALAMAAFILLFAVPRLAAQATPQPDFRPLSLVLPQKDGQIRLLGLGFDRPADGRLGLTLYWQALGPVGELENFVALVDDGGNVAGVPHRQPLAGAYPTDRWQVGEIVADRVELELPTGFDLARARLNTGYQAAGLSNNPTVAFRVPIEGSIESPSMKEASLPPLKLVMADVLGLESHPSAKATPVVTPGAALPVSLNWRALGAIPGNLGVYLHLVDEKGKMWAQVDSPAGPESYPPILWPSGERVREIRQLAVPQEAPPGRYTLRLGAYRYPDLQSVPVTMDGQVAVESSVALGGVFVVAPQTRPTDPRPQRSLKASFGGQVELLGFDLPAGELRPGETIAITTYWRGLKPMAHDYVLFAHLVDAAGGVRGQHDAQPAAGSYPTSLWQVGEYVVDTRTLALSPDLPAGEYRLGLGFYQWPSLERLPATVEGKQAGSAVEVGPLRIASPLTGGKP